MLGIHWLALCQLSIRFGLRIVPAIASAMNMAKVKLPVAAAHLFAQRSGVVGAANPTGDFGARNGLPLLSSLTPSSYPSGGAGENFWAERSFSGQN